MKKIATRLTLTILPLLLCLTVIPATVAAAGDYTYLDETGAEKTTAGLTVTPVTADTVTLSSGWYVVDSDVTRSSSITVSGDAKLILLDGFTLTVTGSGAGIAVSSGNSLTVYGQTAGTGTLSAQGASGFVGIGGGSNGTGGTITICGGNFNTTGGARGEGFGGGD